VGVPGGCGRGRGRRAANLQAARLTKKGRRLPWSSRGQPCAVPKRRPPVSWGRFGAGAVTGARPQSPPPAHPSVSDCVGHRVWRAAVVGERRGRPQAEVAAARGAAQRAEHRVFELLACRVWGLGLFWFPASALSCVGGNAGNHCWHGVGPQRSGLGLCLLLGSGEKGAGGGKTGRARAAGRGSANAEGGEARRARRPPRTRAVGVDDGVQPLLRNVQRRAPGRAVIYLAAFGQGRDGAWRGGVGRGGAAQGRGQWGGAGLSCPLLGPGASRPW
jgi:hypothetical protein